MPGCLVLLTFHVADKTRRRSFGLCSRKWHASLPCHCIFSRMPFEDFLLHVRTNPQRHDASVDIVKGYYSHVKIHYRQYVFRPAIVSNVDLFVWPFCGVNLPWNVYVPNLLSNDFNKYSGAVLTRDCFSCDDSYTLDCGIEFRRGRARRHEGGESFHRYHVGAAFLLVYFSSWVADLDDAGDRSLSKSNYTPSYTRFIALAGSALRTSKGDLWWHAGTLKFEGCGCWTRICLLGSGVESKLNQSANVIWIPAEATNQFNRSFRLLPSPQVWFSVFLGKNNISLSRCLLLRSTQNDREKENCKRGVENTNRNAFSKPIFTYSPFLASLFSFYFSHARRTALVLSEKAVSIHRRDEQEEKAYENCAYLTKPSTQCGGMGRDGKQRRYRSSGPHRISDEEDEKKVPCFTLNSCRIGWFMFVERESFPKLLLFPIGRREFN